MQRRDVLLEGVFLNVLERLLRERRADHVGLRRGFGKRERQIGLRVAKKVVRAGAFFFGSEVDRDVVAAAGNARVTDALVAKLRAKVGRDRFAALFNRRVHVDLQEEVHAAAQVQTQIHREGVDRKEPLRRVRHEVERHDVGGIRRIRIERLFNHFARLQLFFGFRRLEAHADGILLSALLVEDAVGLDLRLGEQRFDALERVFRHLDRGLARGNLHRGGLSVEVRQRIDETDEESDDDDQVFPKRISVHACLRHAKRCAPDVT